MATLARLDDPEYASLTDVLGALCRQERVRPAMVYLATRCGANICEHAARTGDDAGLE